MASPRLWPSHAPSSPFQSRRCPAPGPPRSLTSGNWARTCVKLLRVSRKFWGWCSYDSQHVHTSTIYLAELRYHIYNQTTCDMCLLVKYDVVKYCNIYIYNIIYVIICIYIYMRLKLLISMVGKWAAQTQAHWPSVDSYLRELVPELGPGSFTNVCYT